MLSSRTSRLQHAYRCAYLLSVVIFCLQARHPSGNLQLLWQYGDRHYHAKRWSEAADWFSAGSHRLFRVNDPSSASKCYRKAALCYIERHEYSRAAAVIRCCPSNEATTHYVAFLTAIHQGRWALFEPRRTLAYCIPAQALMMKVVYFSSLLEGSIHVTSKRSSPCTKWLTRRILTARCYF